MFVRKRDLSPIFGDGRSRSGGGGCGLTVGRLGDDLDPVVECQTENEFWQLVVAIETTPIFLGALDQFEDHRERGLVGYPEGASDAFRFRARCRVQGLLRQAAADSRNSR